MNLKLVIYVLSALCLIVAAAMAPSLLLAVFGAEREFVGWRTAQAFAVGIVVSLALGAVFRGLTYKNAKDHFTASEGFAVVTLGWLLLAGLGAIPLYLCADKTPLAQVADLHRIGASPGASFSYLDAYFETMSGFTTTGSSIFGTSRELTSASGAEIGRGFIEALPQSFLFWRSLTHWLGGMGIVVLCLALLPTLHAGGYLMFQAEVPGPTAERLRPRIRETAAVLWGVYVLLTAAETMLLWLGKMPLFDALCHTFGTMATGGFSTKDASIGYYSADLNGLYIEVVIDIFMFLAGCNFLLHFQALRGDVRSYFKNAEFRFYCFVLAASALALTVVTRFSGLPNYGELGACFRDSIFQTISITTTTGFCTADFNIWPGIGRALMVALMFFGGCTGSTGGGLKQMRIMVVGKCIVRELRRMLRPGLANCIRIGEDGLQERFVASIVGLTLLWLLVFILATVLVAGCLGDATNPSHPPHIDSHITISVTAVAATLNNIGPGLSGVGATANYGWMTDSAKFVLIICMLLGRLEIYSVVVLLLPLAWRR